MKRYSKAFLEKHPNSRAGPGDHQGRLREVQAHPGDRGELPGRHAVSASRRRPGNSRPIATCSSPRPAGWPSSSPRWASNWTPCSTSPWSTRATRCRDSGTCSADGVPKVIVDIQTRPIDPAPVAGRLRERPGVPPVRAGMGLAHVGRKGQNASPACGNCAEVPAEAHPSRRADNAGGVIRPTGAGNEYPGAAPTS